MRLGRLPHDPAAVAAVPPHVMAADAPPPPSYAPPPGFVVEAGYNLTLPTCTCAGLLNVARLWSIRKHGFDLAYQVERLLTFYALVAGCAPTEAAIAATDGLMMLSVLQTAQAHGFQISDQTILVPEFRRIETADLTAMRAAIATCESAYVGYDLRPGDMTGGWIGNVPGPIIGGHCAPPIGYDPLGFIDATWGTERPCDDEWMLSRVQEAYAVDWAMTTA